MNVQPRAQFGTGARSTVLTPYIPKSYIQVSKVHLIQYITDKISNVHMNCEEIPIKSNSYDSFIVGVPFDNADEIRDINSWPSSIAIKKFIHFKKPTIERTWQEDLQINKESSEIMFAHRNVCSLSNCFMFLFFHLHFLPFTSESS